MAKVLVKENNLTNIANAIRSKTGQGASYKPSEMAAAIEGITAGAELPALSNPATAENIQKGFEAIDGSGNVVTGTHVEAEAPTLPTLNTPAAASDIASGKEALDGNGNKITGSLYTVTGDLLTDFGRVKKVGSELEVRSAAISSDKILRSTATVSNRVPLANLGDATAADVVAGKTFTSAAGLNVSGTMANQGAVSSTLNAGGSYTIPAGYHNGSGKVTANSLASQTSATATAGDIMSGKTAWVNGALVTGSASAGAQYEIINVAPAGTNMNTAFYTLPRVTNASGSFVHSSTLPNFNSLIVSVVDATGYRLQVSGSNITSPYGQVNMTYQSGTITFPYGRTGMRICLLNDPSASAIST